MCILPGQAVSQGVVVGELGDDADGEGSVEARGVSPLAVSVLGAALMRQLKHADKIPTVRSSDRIITTLCTSR